MAILETENELRSSNGSVAVSKNTAGVKFPTKCNLAVAIVADPSGDVSHASIYGDPEALLALADLLTAFAMLDQERIEDRNCPKGEGVHTSLTSEWGLTSESINLNLGRLDAKGTNESDWFLQHPPVTIVNHDGTGYAG